MTSSEPKPWIPSPTLSAQLTGPNSNPWLGAFAGEALYGPSHIQSVVGQTATAVNNAADVVWRTVI